VLRNVELDSFYLIHKSDGGYEFFPFDKEVLEYQLADFSRESEQPRGRSAIVGIDHGGGSA
jgi:hypothetical protein